MTDLDDTAREAQAAQSRWVAWIPIVCALATLLPYGFLMGFPAVGRPEVPITAPFAALAFAALQIALPSCRASGAHLLSPANWAVLVFFVQLVAMPLTISAARPSLGTLPFLPSMRAIDQSIVLSVVAFASFSVGYALTRRRGGDGDGEAAPFRIPPWLLLAFAAVGLVGLLLRFSSLGELFATLADPTRFAEVSRDQPATLKGAASTFLRPFLLTSIVMTWCAWVERGGADAPIFVRVPVTVLAAALAVIVGATYEFNRAAFVVPLVALAAAYSVRVRRISVRALVLVVALLAVLAIIPGKYRSGSLTAAELARSSAARQSLFVEYDPAAELQVYGAAPQFAAYLLDTGPRSHERFTPMLLLGSLMSPVPILGKAFRGESGAATYNRLIYGNTGVADQNVPFEAEVYLSLGAAGLVASFFLIGVALARLQRAFVRASTAFDCYALQFTAIWIMFLVQGSLASVSQVFVFFMWPIYAYAFLRLRSRSADEERALDDPGTRYAG